MNNFFLQKKKFFKEKPTIENYALQFKNVSFINKYKNAILKSVNFNIKRGSFTSFLGPIGCGKTTILSLIAGFEKPNEGEILFEKKNLVPVSIQKRPVYTIFQDYALFEDLTIYENISFGLRARNLKKPIILKTIYSMLLFLNLKDSFLWKNLLNDKIKVKHLSGGQKQQVAIFRVLTVVFATNYKHTSNIILLFDEPFSSQKRSAINLRTLQEKFKEKNEITFIMITHDPQEALFLSDTIIVMNEEGIQQIDSPENIYNTPVNSWVASFVGEANIINNAIFLKDNLICFDKKKFHCLDVGFGENEKDIDVVIRPEDIKFTSPEKGFFQGKIISVYFKGPIWEIIFESYLFQRRYLINTKTHYQPETEVGITWKENAIHVMWKEEKDIVV